MTRVNPISPQPQSYGGPDPFDSSILDALLGHVAGTPTPKSVNSSSLSTSQTGAVVAAPYIPLVYGRNLVQGQVITGKNSDPYAPGIWWVIVSEGEIDAVEKTYVNGVDIFASAYAAQWSINVYPGTVAGTHDAGLDTWLAALYPGYIADGFPGVAYVKLTVTGSGGALNQLWPAYVPGYTGSAPVNPTFDFLIRGRKVYDPRLDSTVTGGSGTQRAATPSTWAWSQNPALHWRDVRVISGVDEAYVDEVRFIASANVCSNSSGGYTGGRFISNLVCAPQANVKSYLDQLALACNGYEAWPNGLLTLFVDVENASAPLFTLDSAVNFQNISYSWIDQKNKPTQVRIDFRNKDATPPYSPDFVLVPATLAAGVELVQASFTSSVITDRAHAGRAASYLYNISTGTPLRVEGDATYVGLSALPRGTKLALTTSEGVAAQEVLTDIARETPTGWHMQIRQYSAAIYPDVAVPGTQPINVTPQSDPFATPPDIIQDLGGRVPASGDPNVVVTVQSATQITKTTYGRVDYSLPSNYPFAKQLRIRSGTRTDTWATMDPNAEIVVPLSGNMAPIHPAGSTYSLWISTCVQDVTITIYNANGTASYQIISGGNWATCIKLENAMGVLSSGLLITSPGTYSSSGTPTDAGAPVVATTLDLPSIATPAVAASGKSRAYFDGTDLWLSKSAAAFGRMVAQDSTGKVVLSANAGALPAPPAGTLLHLTQADGVSTRLTLDAFGQANLLHFRRANGTSAFKSNVLTGETLGIVSALGYGATAYSGTRVQMEMQATENWSDTAQGTAIVFYTTKAGGVVTAAKATLDDTGLTLQGDLNGGLGGIKCLTELLTVAAAATTDTAGKIPAGAMVLAVSCRVTTAIPGPTTSFKLSSVTDSVIFTGAVLVALGSTDPGTTHWAATTSKLSTALQSIRLTATGGNPATNAGRVRITWWYWLASAPTS